MERGVDSSLGEGTEERRKEKWWSVRKIKDKC